MTFKVGEYFAAAKVDTFYPFVEVKSENTTCSYSG